MRAIALALEVDVATLSGLPIATEPLVIDPTPPVVRQEVSEHT